MEGLRIAVATWSSTPAASERIEIADTRVEELDRLANTEVKRVVIRKEIA